MITLATLPKATEQEVFDQIVGHLLEQNAASSNVWGQAMYLDEMGRKSATGCLIGSDEYSTDVEGLSWDELIEAEIVPDDHRSLIFELQYIHNFYSVNEWRKALNDLGDQLGLTWKFG